MSTVVECHACGKPYLPGEATFCTRCGARLPESKINIRDIPRDKEINFKKRTSQRRYEVLAFTAGLQMFFGWIMIISALLFSSYLYSFSADISDALYSTVAYADDGYSKLTGEPVSKTPFETIPIAISLLVAGIGVVLGVNLVAHGQLIFLFINLNDELSGLAKEQLTFFAWFVKRKLP